MKISKTRLITLLLVGTLGSASLVGCSAITTQPSNHQNYETQEETQSKNSEKPSPGNTNNNDSNNNNINDNNNSSEAIYKIQIEYYEKLIADLEARLLNEKEENYIQIIEYKEMIKELEKNIKDLSDKVASLNSSQNKPPENNVAENKPNDSNTPSTQKPSDNSQNSTSKPSTTPDNNVAENPDNSNNSQPSDDRPSSTQPDNLASESQFTYSIKNDVITITAYKGRDLNVSIPAQINGIPVTSIGEGAFKDSAVQKVTIPSSVTYIDWFAFSGCKSLYEITIPSSVTKVGYGAFENCSASLVIKCKKGSYIDAYAKSWGLLAVSN